ncbi:DNA repair protein rad2 [Schaereria dolodes]|nr:DNA repair protein rad2 [Schaereria dolodes]
MGVTGLWTVVQPCARPIKIETLNRKRLAVDASIWIYQFLKAVRDKEGNSLRNSHVVGFFRRICKLLFFGIKPVFVFDGGAPALKRQTVSGRKARREGRREDAVRTAGKLLALQMQRRAEEEDKRRRDERDRPVQDREEEEILENLVYVDELQMTAQERQQNRRFKKKDAYHLPDLDVGLAEMGAPNDPRIMSQEELEEYARQFHTGEDINLYDFSKIDFNSPFFLSLPASDRYNILNAARLRSRLRMGYSKDQLDTMFPDRMAFSRFQIERVAERNELTQRLMNLNGMNGEDAMFGVNGGGRIAGEKGKEYVLVKNDGVEGGWALGVVSNRNEGNRNKPIEVEDLARDVKVQEDNEDDWEEDGFEDVPIEGLNRLPKRSVGTVPVDINDDYQSIEAINQRRAVYKARQEAVALKHQSRVVDEDPESLFIPQEERGETEDFEVDDNDELFEDVPVLDADEEDDLNRAIAMSLEDPAQGEISHKDDGSLLLKVPTGPPIDQPLEFNTKNARIGRSIAHMTNARANGVSPRPFLKDGEVDHNMDLQTASTESRPAEQQPRSGLQGIDVPQSDQSQHRSTKSGSGQMDPADSAPLTATAPLSIGFKGPLPFESLSLGKSILSKKKKKPVEENGGGFEKEAAKPGNSAQPLPPWFSGDIRKDDAAQKAIENQQFDGGNAANGTVIEKDSVLRRQETGEVIDLDAPNDVADDIIEVASSGGEDDDVVMGESVPIDSEVRMGDIADLIRAEPPKSDIPQENTQALPSSEQVSVSTIEPNSASEPEKEPIEWDESDLEDERLRQDRAPIISEPAGGSLQIEEYKSSSPEFENVGIRTSPMEAQPLFATPIDEKLSPSSPAAESVDQTYDLVGDDEDIYSDPEDEDLMRQLAVEAEEHARFASTLNSKSQLQNAEDYERELRQLRNQQKKDRRDADEVSHIMITECQQLLKLFGLPYVTAPMEAEAQCAELVSLGLVDGIVTDDSDIFLFGGTRVYKNMFNQAKFVECYLSSDLEKEYSLTREKLIQIAHLLGSDYTEGLPSVGPVTALEILSEFASLEDFKDWWSYVQTGHKDTSSPFRRKFGRNATKLFLPPTFPDKRVDHAYLQPDVDSDPSPFAWGVPDLDALRQFLMATIGWSQERTDEVLVPVIKDMNRRETEGTQANITRFFEGTVGVGARAIGDGVRGGEDVRANGGGAFAPRRRKEGKSKRMESALGRLHEQATNRTHGESEVPDGNGVRKSEGSVRPERSEESAAQRNDNAETKDDMGKKRRTRKTAVTRQEAFSASRSATSDSEASDAYEASQKPRKRAKVMAKKARAI